MAPKEDNYQICTWCKSGRAPDIQKQKGGYWWWGYGSKAKYVCPNHKTEQRPSHLM